MISNDYELSLVEKAKQGDDGAWTLLCQNYMKSLYRFLYYRVNQQEHDARDVLQDVLLTAVERIHRYRPDASFYAWLIGIARHKLQHYYRAKGRRQALEVALERLDDEMTGDKQDKISAPSLQTALNQRQWPPLMAAALSALSARDQELLLKKYADRCTIEEVAAQVGGHPKAIASALLRAKASFAYAFHQLSQSQVFQNV